MSQLCQCGLTATDPKTAGCGVPACRHKSAPAARPELRYVTVRGICYLRIDDVADLLRDIAAGEETDVRRRLDALATKLLQEGT